MIFQINFNDFTYKKSINVFYLRNKAEVVLTKKIAI